VLWELLSGKRLFDADSEAEVLSKVLLCQVPPLDVAQGVLEKALEREPSLRFATAAEMADALDALGVAPPNEVAAWLRTAAKDTLAAREALLKTKRRPAMAWVALPLLALAAVFLILHETGKQPPSVPEPIALPAPSPPAPPTPVPAPLPGASPQVIVVHQPGTGRKAPPKPDCTPPYTIDAAGVKRFKVECLH